MIPVTFSGAFGWLHPADGPRGVILCGPLNYDALCVHRAWAALAERLANDGMPVLRFDYPGTGDSDGDDRDPGRVRAWLDSIAAATSLLRRESGTTEIALVGLRAGAVLAAEAAIEMGGVEALALLAPCLSGKNYVRELQTLAATGYRELANTDPVSGNASSAQRADASGLEPGCLEAGGFVLTAETKADLSRLDLLKLPTRPARRILMLEHVGSERLATHLTRLGAEVTREKFAAYPDFMRDAHRSTVPDRDFARLAAWLGRDVPVNVIDERQRRVPVHVPLELPGCKEEAVRFGVGGRGGDHGLVGVQCTPRGVAPVVGRPAVILLNTGANHRIGPNRMSVSLARHMAGQGITSLRIDAAGIGDSPNPDPMPETLLYSDTACADVRAAMDHLQRQGLTQIVLVGLCWGAYLAFHTALSDHRVVGQILINSQKFIWRPGDSLEVANRRAESRSNRYYAQAVWRGDTWARLARGDLKLATLARIFGHRLSEKIVRLFRKDGTAQSELDVAGAFRDLSARGVSTVFVYSDEDAGLDEFEMRLGRDGRKLANCRNVRLELIVGADHTLTAHAARQGLTMIVDDFMERLPKAADQADRAA